MRALIPLVLIFIAIGVFVGYTNPSYQATKNLQTEYGQYQAALTTSKQLKAQRDTLLSKRNTFSADDVQKLERMLPDNVDNIRLVIDINNIAARHSLTLKNVNFGTVSDGSQPSSAAAVGAAGTAVGSVQLNFTVSASYDNFQAFLLDIEHSLRLIDVEKIDFKTSGGSGSSSDYNVTIQTYWLH